MRRKSGRTTESTEVCELLELCREGHVEAWEQVIRTFSPLVWTVARSYRLSDSDCEDVYQLTWQRLIENLDSITQPERLGTWLVTVARRESIQHANKARPTVCVDGSHHWNLQPGSPDDIPENQVLDRTGHEILLEEVRQLPDQQQALLGMLFTDPPLPYDTISRNLGLPRGSIGPMRQRILQRLRTSIDARFAPVSR